jgi:hypothetical protein
VVHSFWIWKEWTKREKKSMIIFSLDRRVH